MILVFNIEDGSFNHACSSINKFYENNSDYVWTKYDDFDPAYTYTFVEGEVVKGDLFTLTEEEQSRFEAEIAATVHVEPRKLAYPSLEEQLDKLFHDIENGTLDQSGEFFNALKAVKDAYPKPE